MPWVDQSLVKEPKELLTFALTNFFTLLLGTENINQAEQQARVVGYKADGKIAWVATDRFDLTAEQIALIYKLR